MIQEKTQEFFTNKQTIGIFMQLSSAAIVECIGNSDLDYIIFDREHGVFDPTGLVDVIRAAELSNIMPLVRVQDHSRSAILNALDSGARSLVVPNVDSLEDAKQLVKFAKFKPIGSRGFAMARAAGFGFKVYGSTIEEYLTWCNRATLLLLQCETKACLENIEAISALEGVDGIFIGPYDLSAELDIPGQFESATMQQAFKKILTACQTAHKFCFIFTNNAEEAKQHLMAGFNSITMGTDTGLFTNAARALATDLTSKLTKES